MAGQAGELAVVGRQDRRARPSGEVGRGIVAEGGQAVAVDQDRHAGRGHHLRTAVSVGRCAEARPEDERAGPIELLEHDRVPPAGGAAMPTASVGRPGS